MPTHSVAALFAALFALISTLNIIEVANTPAPTLTKLELAAQNYIWEQGLVPETTRVKQCTNSTQFQNLGGPIYRKTTCTTVDGSRFVLKNVAGKFVEVLTAELVS